MGKNYCLKSWDISGLEIISKYQISIFFNLLDLLIICWSPGQNVSKGRKEKNIKIINQLRDFMDDGRNVIIGAIKFNLKAARGKCVKL